MNTYCITVTNIVFLYLSYTSHVTVINARSVQVFYAFILKKVTHIHIQLYKVFTYLVLYGLYIMLKFGQLSREVDDCNEGPRRLIPKRKMGFC